MVVCKLWRGKSGTAISFPFTMRMHTSCWVQRGIIAAESRVRPETRGRIRLAMDDATHAKRTKILARRAAVIQRIHKEVDKPKEKQSFDKIIHLGAMLEELKQEIVEYGGAPKGW